MSSLKIIGDIHDENNYEYHLFNEREAKFTQIASDVHKIHDIFADLSEMVDGQQNNFDDIENQVSIATTNTIKGVKQLDRASINQRRKTSCLIYLFTFITIILFIIIIAVIVFKNY